MTEETKHRTCPRCGKWSYTNREGYTRLLLRAPDVAELTGPEVFSRPYSEAKHYSTGWACPCGWHSHEADEQDGSLLRSMGIEGDL